ncbi:hypothetical protein C2G38_2200232 [Gigaspora rosea]|uniref:Uncharacterized protein n=1 Tax=Gigaspora rosea TaxID=44941 RepID=A0A397UTV6_9GLOM|nr:hypothetical protein C2G38_2200232 [Gigaspora rosea]
MASIFIEICAVKVKDCDKIRSKIVHEFEGVLSRFGKIETIGILIAPSKNNFTKKSLDRVELSEFNIILTDKQYLRLDLIQFVKSKRIESTQCNKELIRQIELLELNKSSSKFRIINIILLLYISFILTCIYFKL